ncbi:unnamed protein product, partial [Staurois parvus]
MTAGTGSSGMGLSGSTAGIGSPGMTAGTGSPGIRIIRLHQFIRPDQFIRLGTDLRLGTDIRLKCGRRGTRLNHGRQVLRRQALTGLDTGRMVLVGKNFRFFSGFNYWSTASKRRSANEWSS